MAMYQEVLSDAEHAMMVHAEIELERVRILATGLSLSSADNWTWAEYDAARADINGLLDSLKGLERIGQKIKYSLELAESAHADKVSV